MGHWRTCGTGTVNRGQVRVTAGDLGLCCVCVMSSANKLPCLLILYRRCGPRSVGVCIYPVSESAHVSPTRSSISVPASSARRGSWDERLTYLGVDNHRVVVIEAGGGGGGRHLRLQQLLGGLQPRLHFVGLALQRPQLLLLLLHLLHQAGDVRYHLTTHTPSSLAPACTFSTTFSTRRGTSATT